jgi:uncharacterized membrane protein
MDETALRHVQTIADIEAKAEAKLTAVERISHRIGHLAGNAWFVLINIAWIGGWILFNSLSTDPIDPFPFTFLTLLIAIEAFLLTSFVLISQNLSERQSNLRAALALQINIIAEREMTKMLAGITAITEHLGIPEVLDDDETREMASETDVTALADALDKAADGKPRSA